MAMNVGQESGGAIATINTTPLVDVMLVLLIIFLITIPVINKTIPVQLPKAVNIPTQTKPENITIAVNTEGDIFWNDKRVANRNELLGLIEAAAVRKPQPEIHLRPDRRAKYDVVAKVLAAAQRNHMKKIGFVNVAEFGND